MNNLCKHRKLSIRLSLILLYIGVCNAGCVEPKVSQTSLKVNYFHPNTTSQVETEGTQGVQLKPSLQITEPPSNTFSPPSSPLSSQTAPIQPTERPSNLEPLPIPSGDMIWEILEKVNIDRALNDLRKITGEDPICFENECYTINNRYTDSEGLLWAKKYIYYELKESGYSVELQDWYRSGYTDQNIIARKPGTLQPEEQIYFVAHLDGAGSSLGRFPAADDNASGVVDLLELARVLSPYSFSKSIVLLFSTGEEQGTLGVKSYLDQLTPSELEVIKYVVNIDMIGYDENQDRVMELWHGGHAPSIALTQVISDTIQAYNLALKPDFVIGCG